MGLQKMVGLTDRCEKNFFALYQAGFSYIWLLFLVFMMGMGLVVAGETYSTAARRDKEKELLSVGRQFRVAIGRYYETQLSGGRREYPATLDDLLLDPRFPNTKRHLRRIFVDPMTGKAEWGLVMVGGRIVGVHSLSGKVPIKQAGFEGDDLSLGGKASYAEWIFVYPPDLMVQLGLNTVGRVDGGVIDGANNKNSVGNKNLVGQ